MKEADVIIIGAGSGGYTAALQLANHGKKVIMVEKDRPGGKCLLRGCIPSKALIHASDIVFGAGKAENIGIKFDEPVVDMGKIQEWKNTIIDNMVKGIEGQCRKAGVEIIQGQAVFISKNSLKVVCEDGTEEEVSGSHIIIAAGSRPKSIPGFEMDEKDIMSSAGFLELRKVPDSLCVIGGGVIGLELAVLAAKLGSKVTIVELLDDIIPFADQDVLRVIKKGLKNLGIILMTGASAELVQIGEKDIEISISYGSEKSRQKFEKVLIAVGCRPNSDGLGLEGAGIQVDDAGFVKTDDMLRTYIPNIFALGDIRGNPMLAHKASMDGIRVADYIAGNKPEQEMRKAPLIPYVIFSEPELAAVGMNEAEAKADGIAYTAKRYYFAALGKALAMDETDGFVKIIADDKGKILGCSIVGSDASNLISEITVAIEKGMTVKDIAEVVHPHPTLSEAIWENARHLSK